MSLCGAGENWPQFKGANGLGVGAGWAPVQFGKASNVLWRVEVAQGNSSPVIWGEKLFLTGFAQGTLRTICYSKVDGRKVWEKELKTEWIEPAHPLNGPAAPTPVTDGEGLYVYFGSYGLIAYDLDGNEIWSRSLPVPVVEFGTSASPVLAEGKLILLCDQDLNSFVLAVDARSGKDIWKTERPQFRRSFASPFVWRNRERSELIVPGSIFLKSYDLGTGAELWTYEGTSRVATSTPTGNEEMLFSGSWNIGGDPSDRVRMPAFKEFAERNDTNRDGIIVKEEIADRTIRDRYTQMDLDKNGKVTEEEWTGMKEMFEKANNGLLAIRPGGKGVVNTTHVAWKVTRSLPYVSSPLYFKGKLYTVRSGGLASCYDAASGKVFYQDERLGALGDYYASGIAAGDAIYYASQNGMVTVIRAGEKLEILARNDLEEQIFATPAVSENRLFYRTSAALYCFGNDR